MSRGKQKVNYIGSAGDVVSQGVPSWNFIYEVSTVKNPRYNLGDRVVLPDGRVFRYCKSGAVCDTFKANVFFNAIPATGIDYAVLAEGASKGDNSVLLTSSAIAQTLDGLRGGNINITTGSDDGRDQQRGIIGNTACSIGGTCRVYLDAPLTEAVTTSWYAYCMPSPYSDVRRTDEIEGYAPGKCSFVGYAAAKVNAANLYHWEQTWGPLSCSLYGSAVGKTQYMREVVFRYDGNLIHRGATGVTGLEAQTAGFILDNNIADNGATFIMLQIAP